MRIVSLCPSLTETVFDLGKGDSLVGRTRFCVHPANGVGAIERVGGTKNPKIDRIVELAPDLVLLNEEENRREDAAALSAAGVAVHVSFPRTISETAEMVRSIGGALGAADRAEVIANEIESRSARVLRDSADARPIRYGYLIWQNPLMVAPSGTFVSAMLSLAGGINVFPDRGGEYPVVEQADIQKAQPDVLFLSTEPFPFTRNHMDAISVSTGFPVDRMFLADGEYLSWHGSRTPAGIDYAEQLMNSVRAS